MSSRRHSPSARLLATLAALGTVGGVALAAPRTAPEAGAALVGPDADRSRQVVAAAQAYGVPARVLSGYAAAQTGWVDHGASPSVAGGYGPGHLVDASGLETGGRDGGGAGDRSGVAAKERLDTLGRAARLTGISRERLMTDPAANLRGTAAVIADAQRRLHRPTGASTSPRAWREALASAAGGGALGADVADTAVAAAEGGTTGTTSAQRVAASSATAATSSPTSATRTTAALPASTRTRGTNIWQQTRRRTWNGVPSWPVTGLECPAQLACDWRPAPYRQTGSLPTEYGNHDIASRPVAPSIETIVIHDSETSYSAMLSVVQDPSYLAWAYSLRSSDGRVAQHLSTKDVGWHAGNWYVNSHSIGLEHEGYAAKGGAWFTDAMYRSSAALVRQLAARYAVPLDRGHVIGHDQVPGSTADTIRTMHWDPGPFWDWQRYFSLLGAPLDAGTAPAWARPQVGQVVRVLPRFATNVQPLTGCTTAGVRCAAQGSNVVPVRTSPSSTAPLVNDIGLRPTGAASTWDVSDWGGKASQGTDFVVAAVRGDWVAIWFAGRLGWVYDPASAPTLRVLGRARVATPAPGVTASTYGRAYPEAGAYPAGEEVQEVSPLPYRVPAGQAYVVLDEDPPTDYYKAKTFDPATPGDHRTIAGRDRYVLVSLGHRVAYLRAAELTLRTVG